jgi:hypothetical protein
MRMKDGTNSATCVQAEDGKAREKQDAEIVERLVEDSEADLERKRSAAAAAAWGGQPPAPPAEVQSVPQVRG